ncbi:MAG: sigma-54 dependent transcriptional regulator [Myxococcota bacterium]
MRPALDSGVRVLVCDDEASLREMLRILLSRQGHQVEVAKGTQDAIAALQRADPFDAVITDLLMPGGSGLDVLAAARKRSESTQVIVITAFTSTQRAVEAMRQGAYDFLEKPFQNDVLLATLDKALEKRAIVDENAMLRAQAEGLGIIGVSNGIRSLRGLIVRAAKTRTSVLVTGESGTGKELVARALHEHSVRAQGPFRVVNCGALPENLMESELFGHEKGAFTGADQRKEGLIRAAGGGTLFLDEVGELPLALQVKLLRVLQERSVRPVGSEREEEVDIRLVAATNRDLEAEVEQGTFREDLFYRLNVIRLRIPPLRDRPEDIRPLAQHLLEKHNAAQERTLSLSDAALAWLALQPFPGNVRELENLIERAVALAPNQTISVEDFGVDSGDLVPRVPAVLPADFDVDAHLGAIERTILLKALDQSEGVRKRAAELLGMTFRQFRYRLAKYDLDNE